MIITVIYIGADIFSLNSDLAYILYCISGVEEDILKKCYLPEDTIMNLRELGGDLDFKAHVDMAVGETNSLAATSFWK